MVVDAGASSEDDCEVASVDVGWAVDVDVGVSLEDDCEAAPEDAGSAVDLGAVPGNVSVAAVLWLDNMLAVAKLKPLTGMANIEAVEVITTVAVNASGCAC